MHHCCHIPINAIAASSFSHPHRFGSRVAPRCEPTTRLTRFGTGRLTSTSGSCPGNRQNGVAEAPAIDKMMSVLAKTNWSVMASAPASATKTTKNVFDAGKYKTVLRRVGPGTRCSKSELPVPPPKPLLIATPREAGEFPLLVFLHGFVLPSTSYSQLMQHIASHGCIVIAPELYPMPFPFPEKDATVDINSAAETTNWLPQGLHYWLPPHVQPNMRKIGLAGHSRGGKAAFALARRKAATSLKFSALIGIDPVDGMQDGTPIPPPVTTLPHPLHLDMPVMVIGTELGGMEKHCCCCTLPAAAPEGINHEAFFRKCEKPACHLVAKDYGHCDMLDDKIGWIYELLMCLFNSGNSRKPMRRLVGGAIVAFMKAHLLGDNSDLKAIRDEILTPPVVLKNLEFLE